MNFVIKVVGPEDYFGEYLVDYDMMGHTFWSKHKKDAYKFTDILDVKNVIKELKNNNTNCDYYYYEQVE